jgi:hypothetical protein
MDREEAKKLVHECVEDAATFKMGYEGTKTICHLLLLCRLHKTPAFNKHALHINWDPNEKEWLGTSEEFPELSHFDATPEEAFTGILALVKAAREIKRISGMTD